MSLLTRIATGLGLRSEPPHTTPEETVAAAIAERTVWASPKRSARVAAVFTAVGILATAVEQISLDLERNDIPIDSGAFLRRPDPALPSRSAWLHQLVVSLALHGNAYCRVWRNAAGHAETARVLPPGQVRPWTDDRTGQVRYAYQGKNLTHLEVLHLQFLRIPGELTGLGPIQAAQAELTGHIDLTAASANWVRDSGSPSGLLSTEQQLNADQRKTLLTSWNNTPAGRTRLMSNGLTYAPMAINPKDAQFLESRRFSKTEIMDLFGIPASLSLGIDKGDSQTYANVSQDWLGFVRFRLMRYVREIEEGITSLLPRGQQARMNLEALLRADAETRYRIHDVAIGAGIYSAAHAREIERIPATAAPATPPPVKEPAA